MSNKKKSKSPRINITSIPDTYDYFPQYDTSNSSGLDGDLLNQLKMGTYQAHMQLSEYTAKIKGKNHQLISAAPKEFSAAVQDTYPTVKEKKNDKARTVEMVPQRTPQYPSRYKILQETFKNSNVPLRPRHYHNPRQYFDHILLSDAYVNSFGGTVMDTYTEFIMPKSIKPVLKLRHPAQAGDKKAQEKLLKDNNEIIEKLESVDLWFSDKGRTQRDPLTDVPMQQKFRDMITNLLTFGREAMVYEKWSHLDPVSVGNEEFAGIPNVIKLLHPIEMGMLEIDDYTWKLGGMYVHSDRSYIPSNEMLYMVNQYQNPQIGGLMYGYSKLQRAIDPIRLLRRIFAKNYQSFIRASYSGMGAFVFDSSGYDDGVRETLRRSLKESYKAGEIAVIDYANIKEFKFEQFNINVKISELQELQQQLIKVVIGVTGIPQSLVFDESAANRATLVGRIVSFINNQITTQRSMISDQISSQWYNRVFRSIYGKSSDADILETFYIDCEFEEMELETKIEKVGRLLQEQQLNPYNNEYIGEELGDKDYLEHIDEEKIKSMSESQPMKPAGGGAFNVENTQTGQTSKVTAV